MAHHQSAKKRIRQNAVRRLRNRYRMSTTRNAIRALRGMEDKPAASKRLPEVISMIDKLVKHNQIHANKAANLKSSLSLKVNSLG